MASVLFSTVGQAVAGPLGGALGSLVGGQADSLLAGSRRRPLPELQVQTSAYGDSLPAIHGSIRLAGTLIWLSEGRAAGGGKGGTARSSALVASMAIALSSRRIGNIGRIWADGREIRNAAGMFATSTTMRVYRGDWLQRPDPAIEEVEGIGNCPAYRGLAYVVFEDMLLSPYGNRVPNFSFEVVADEGGDPIEWLLDMGHTAGVTLAVADQPLPITGYRAGGTDWGQAIADLAQAIGCDVQCLGKAEQGDTGAGTARERLFALGPSDVLAPENSGRSEPGRRLSRAASRAGRWTVGYLDPARDYAAGSQQVWSGRQGAEGRTAVPMAATATQARAIAQEQLLSDWASAERLDLWLPWRWMELRPGHRVKMGDDRRIWRIESWTLDHSGIRVDARLETSGLRGPSPAGEPGRGNLWPATPVPESVLFTCAPPAPIAGEAPGVVHVVATGASGWRGAELAWRAPGSPDAVALGYQGRQRPYGQLESPLPSGLSGVWTLGQSVDLVLADAAFVLEGRSLLAVLQGANLLLVGSELIQFAEVESRGEEGKVRLSRLLRGQAGTRAQSHAAGERWCLLEPAGTARLAVPGDWIGGTIAVEARGAGDTEGGAEHSVLLDGGGLGPLAPCHLRSRFLQNGDLELGWIPRSREDFGWQASNVLPLGSFRIWLWAGTSEQPDAAPVSAITFATSQTFSAAVVDQVLAGGPGPLWFQIESIGIGPADLRLSFPISIATGRGSK